MLRIAKLSCMKLKDINFIVKPGECLALSGPSGSGKSTILRAIADLDVHEGEVSWQGTSQADIPAHQWRQRVAYLPAESAWWFDTVGEHFKALDQVWFEQLGLHVKILDSLVSHLSSGERQRLALLRVLSRHPQVLLLDEPTANLDELSRKRVEKLIEIYRQENQATVVWVGHDLEQLKRVASHHLVIDQQSPELKVTSWTA